MISWVVVFDDRVMRIVDDAHSSAYTDPAWNFVRSQSWNVVMKNPVRS